MSDEEHLETFNMSPADIDEADQVRVLGDDEPGETTQRVVRHVDGRRAHRHRQLIQITPGSDSEHRRVSDHDVPVTVTDRASSQHGDRSEGGHRKIPTLASIRSDAR